jgi:hypothetical protein
MTQQQYLVLTLIVPLFTGCLRATDVSRTPADSPVTIQSNSFDIKKATLGHMFERFAPSRGEASESGFACFILAASDESERLVAAFSDCVIPVLGPERLSYRNECSFDSETDSPAMLWEIEIKSQDDRQATVYVEWWLGPEGAAGYSVRLAKRANEWIVESVDEEWMS